MLSSLFYRFPSLLETFFDCNGIEMMLEHIERIEYKDEDIILRNIGFITNIIIQNNPPKEIAERLSEIITIIYGYHMYDIGSQIIASYLDNFPDMIEFFIENDIFEIVFSSLPYINGKISKIPRETPIGEKMQKDYEIDRKSIINSYAIYNIIISKLDPSMVDIMITTSTLEEFISCATSDIWDYSIYAINFLTNYSSRDPLFARNLFGSNLFRFFISNWERIPAKIRLSACNLILEILHLLLTTDVIVIEDQIWKLLIDLCSDADDQTINNKLICILDSIIDQNPAKFAEFAEQIDDLELDEELYSKQQHILESIASIEGSTNYFFFV